MMPLHMQAIYIYLVKYNFTVDELYYNLHSKEPLGTTADLGRNVKTFDTPAFTRQQAMDHILRFAMLKPNILIADPFFNIDKVHKDMVMLIAERAQTIPLRKRIMKMRVGRILDTVIDVVMKGIGKSWRKEIQHT
jgi:hypothetical protein